MSYNARKLITEAYYLSGVVARDLESVSGSQITNGLEWLNEIISGRNLETSFIPYTTKYDLTLVSGQEKYFIPKLIEPETFTFFLSNVRYSTRPMKRRDYFGTSRAEDIKSLPYAWHTEKVKGGSDLYVYFSPQSNYPSEIWGKFGLDDDVELDEDLSLVYEKNYTNYLKYFLAQSICSNYQKPLTPTVREQFEKLRDDLRDNSPKDMSVNSYNSSGYQAPLSYADVNIGRGYRP